MKASAYHFFTVEKTANLTITKQ